MNETFLLLNSILRNLANRAAMGAAYESWSDAFARKECREIWTDTEERRLVTAADFASLTEDQRSILGFPLWDEGGPYLIPLWAFNYIADGERLTCIDGTVKVKGVDKIDLDVRFGCIAHGFQLADLPDAEEAPCI